MPRTCNGANHAHVERKKTETINRAATAVLTCNRCCNLRYTAISPVVTLNQTALYSLTRMLNPSGATHAHVEGKENRNNE